MSNSKDYYKMRYGQAGFDPTEIEPQSIFDGRAMDFGASIASTAVSRKKVIEENEKGLKEKETIVNGDDSIVETSVFKPHLKAGTDSGFDVKAGLPMPISDGGIAAILENESAIDRKNDVQNRMDLLSIGMMPGEEYNIPATGSNIDMPNREQLAENIFVEDFTKQLDASKEIATGVNVDDVTTINNNVSGQAMAQEFQNDLAQANGDPAKIEAAKSEFESGLFDLSQYDPQLAKSLFAMMGAMLMGESFGDAMATGFGVMEEAKQEKEAADTANDQKIIEMLMDNPQYMNPDDFLAALQELGISEKDLPYYKSIFASKVAETNVKAAKEYVTLQANATKTIKSDLIKDDNSNHIDELNRLFSHIQNNDKDFDFSDPGQSWAVYEAFSNWEQAKRIAKEEGNDEIIMEPTVFYENLFGLLDANGDNTITVPQSQDNQVLQAIVKNALRTVYRTKEGADEAEKRISREWHSNSINKSKSSEEYLKYLAMEANDLEREYLAGLRK